jgi:hypothetical protein
MICISVYNFQHILYQALFHTVSSASPPLRPCYMRGLAVSHSLRAARACRRHQ